MLRIFNHYLSPLTLFLVLSENLLILGTLYLSTLIKLGDIEPSSIAAPAFFSRALTLALLCQLCLYFHDLYDLKVVRDRRELHVRLLQALGVCSMVVAILYWIFPSLLLGQGVFLLAVLLLLVLVSIWRVAFNWISHRREFKRPILILGTGSLAKKLCSEVLDRPDLGMRILGFVSDDVNLVGTSLINPRVLGHYSDLARIVESERSVQIVVAMEESRGRLPVKELLDLKMRGASIEEGTALYERITGKIAVENLRPSWLIFSEGFRKSRWVLGLKRVSGILLSLVGLIVTAPIMLVIAVLIKTESRGPVLFKQNRVGENGKIFRLLKFRSMWEDAEALTGPVWACADDRRVTRVGRWIRRLRMDELPQFINVLRGDMSFVGPRPERPHFVEQLSEQIPFYNQRHTVKPGITGWAQINFHYGMSMEDTLEKLQYDLFYIKNMSFTLDLSIIFQTIKIVLSGRGAH
ncbi:MAG: TIGR03013 family XrtA/PEP-CTERM system glycosyltransferase [Acidobacteriota bacterium]